MPNSDVITWSASAILFEEYEDYEWYRGRLLNSHDFVTPRYPMHDETDIAVHILHDRYNYVGILCGISLVTVGILLLNGRANGTSSSTTSPDTTVPLLEAQQTTSSTTSRSPASMW